MADEKVRVVHFDTVDLDDGDWREGAHLNHRRRWLRFSALCLGATFLAACSTSVMVPNPNADHAPTVAITWLAVGGSGSTCLQNGTLITSTSKSITLNLPGPVDATQGSKLMFSAKASNPGGVKTLELIGTPGGGLGSLWDVRANGQLDGQNLAPDSLSIFGSNGGGPVSGPGNNPFFLSFYGPLNQAGFGQAASVNGIATNFNGQTTSITVVFREAAVPQGQALCQ